MSKNSRKKDRASQYTDYNNFDEGKDNNSKDKNNINLIKNNSNVDNKNAKNIKYKEKKKCINKKHIKEKNRSKSFEIKYKKIDDLDTSLEKSEEERYEYKFTFDKSIIKKCQDKIEEFPSFSDISQLKEIFLEKNIKKLINYSKMLYTYQRTNLNNKNLSELEFDSLINPKESFEINKERLKFGVSKYIFNFEKIMLSRYNFSFDDSNIKKLDLFVDKPNDNHLNYFSKNNHIFKVYKKKNVKALNISSEKDIQKPIQELKIDNDSDIYGSISKINQRWLNKIKFTKKINAPTKDNYKIIYNFKNSLEIPLIEQVFNEFAKQKIRTHQFDISTVPKVKIDFYTSDFVTEYYLSFKEDIIKIKKLNLEGDNLFKDPLKQINMMYNNKYLLNMDIQVEELNRCNINTFSLKDIDISLNYEKFKKFKEDIIKIKKNYILSGKASIQLMKNSLTNNIYDNPKTSLLHNLSIQLNEINDKINNDSLKLTMIKSANNNYPKCAKKLKDEIDLSLNNINTVSNKMGNLIKIKSENLGFKNELSLNLKNKKNEESNSGYKNMMKKIKKSENEINKKKRKIFVEKTKQQQEKEFEQDIKKEKNYKIIYPILIAVFSLIFSVYKHFWNDDY